MTTLHLVRHGSNDALRARRLAGRDWTLDLNDEGCAQAERRAGTMRDLPLAAILSSPLPRCQETAAPLARITGLEPEIRDELLELEFGEWTGAAHADLDRDDQWRRFKAFRAGTPPPGGETLADVRARMLRLALELRERFPDGEVAIFGHGDPLVALILQLIGLGDDAIDLIEFGPCAWATLEFGSERARLARLSPLD